MVSRIFIIYFYLNTYDIVKIVAENEAIPGEWLQSIIEKFGVGIQKHRRGNINSSSKGVYLQRYNFSFIDTFPVEHLIGEVISIRLSRHLTKFWSGMRCGASTQSKLHRRNYSWQSIWWTTQREQRFDWWYIFVIKMHPLIMVDDGHQF